jgi:hypothetical protein
MRRRLRSATTRRALAEALAALMLTLPTAAYPIGLAHLLRLPLEQLLQLQITPSQGVVTIVGGERHGR